MVIFAMARAVTQLADGFFERVRDGQIERAALLRLLICGHLFEAGNQVAGLAQRSLQHHRASSSFVQKLGQLRIKLKEPFNVKWEWWWWFHLPINSL